MLLSPHEQERLLVYLAALLAQERRERGLRLNYPEAVAVISSFVLEGARDGRSVADLMAAGQQILTSEDVITRALEHGVGGGVGLRGGTFTAAAAAEGYRITLNEIRWTEDVSVSGVIDCAGRTGRVHGALHVRASQGANGTLEVEWTEGAAQPRASITGKLATDSVVADAPAP